MCMSSIQEQLAAIDFHSYTEDTECIAAIYEAREYVHENGRGSRDEMWGKFVLDTSTLSPGREACRSKGYIPKFRDWWWDVIVTPGFRVLPSVEPAGFDELTWRVAGARHERNQN